MARPFSDRLMEAIVARKTPCTVNLDPVYEQLPPEFITPATSPGTIDTGRAIEAVCAFCRRILTVIGPLVPAVKINSAFFERYHAAGIQAYDDLVDEASRQGLIVIGDVKRGDIGHTASHYAQAQLSENDFAQASDRKTPDAITINGYFGWDGVKPFIQVAREEGKGVFVLVRTSNDSAASIQDIVTEGGQKMHEIVASLVDRWANESDTLGACGFTSVGAVVATRNPADAARLRLAMPRSIFLVPGYGAQGGRAESFRPYFNAQGRGAIVAAGRSILYAHRNPQYRERFGEDWQRCVEHACRDFVADVDHVVSVC